MPCIRRQSVRRVQAQPCRHHAPHAPLLPLSSPI